MFRFASPYFLIFLVVIPALAAWRSRQRLAPALGVSSLGSVRQIPRSAVLKIGTFLPVLKYLVLLLVILAIARPQWGTRQTTQLTEGINIILAVDLSESMAALDFKEKKRIVNRLTAAKGVIREFIGKRTGDRIGLVVFGTHAYTQLPLTRDYNTIATILDRLEIGAAGKSTAIGDAVGISLKRLEDIESRSNVIILLTDGQSNSGELSPETAGEIAAQRGVKIYTVGIGSRGKAPFLVRDPVFGERYVYHRVDIDEAALGKMAEKTGGLYNRAENTQGLEKIYETIDRMEKTEIKVKSFAQYRELYPFLLTPAFVVLGLWVLLSNTRYLRVP